MDEDKKYPDCGGTGRMVHEKEQSEYLMSSLESGAIAYNPDTMKVKICKNCKGLGYFIDSNGNKTECSECKGFGRIINYNVNTEHQMNEFNIPSE